MNSLGKYVLTKTQKIVLLVVVFALIAGGYYAGFYLPVQRRIEAADTAELDAQIQLEQMKAMQIRQMEEEIEENKASNAQMVPAYNHFKTETEELYFPVFRAAGGRNGDPPRDEYFFYGRFV